MARWQRDEEQKRRLRHAADDAKNSDKGTGRGGRGSGSDTAVDECRNKMIYRVAGYRFDVLLQTHACTSLLFVLFRPGSRYLPFLSTSAFRLL